MDTGAALGVYWNDAGLAADFIIAIGRVRIDIRKCRQMKRKRRRGDKTIKPLVSKVLLVVRLWGG